MSILFRKWFIIIILLTPFFSSAEVIELEAKYSDFLIWEAGNIIINNRIYVEEIKFGPFVTNGSVSSYFEVSEKINSSKESDLILTLTDIRKIKPISKNFDPYSFNPEGLPYLSKSTSSTDIIDRKKPLKVYYIKKQKTDQMKKWELIKKKYDEDIKRYNKLSSNEKIRATKPNLMVVHAIRPSDKEKYKYTIVKEYHIDFKNNKEYEFDYSLVIDSNKERLNNKNIVVVFVIIFILLIIWFFIKVLKSLVSKIKNSTAIKLKNIKYKRHQSKVRAITEAAVISETVKNELKNKGLNEITQLKNQIIGAIEAGNHEEAEILLKLAERLKKLDT